MRLHRARLLRRTLLLNPALRLRRVLAALGVVTLLAIGITACSPAPIVPISSASGSADVGPLLVGTPAARDGENPMEAALLANLYASALNAAGVKATVSAPDSSSGTMIARLERGTVDVAPGYSSEFLQEATPQGSAPLSGAVNAEQVIAALKKALPKQVTMLDAASAQDTDSIVVTAVTAQKYQLRTIGDLAKVCDKLDFGGTAAFRTKDRGLGSMGSDYNCVPKKYVELPSTNSELLLALLRDDVQIADIHSSSPAIPDNALVVLSDTKQLFVPANVVPLVAAAKVSPDVQGVLNKVTAALSTEELSNLNRLASANNFATLSEVAHTWLVQRGLLEAKKAS